MKLQYIALGVLLISLGAFLTEYDLIGGIAAIIAVPFFIFIIFRFFGWFSREEQKNPQKIEIKHSLLSWSMKPEEIEFQAENYNSLKLIQSARGGAVLVTLLFFIFEVISGFYSASGISVLDILVVI